MFDWFDTHPQEATNFSAGLGGLTLAEAPSIIGGYPFPDRGVICDIAGGQGALLAEILKSRPNLKGVLVDSAPTLEHARDYLQVQGVQHRVDVTPGDLLGEINARADLYLLKWILHDWDDATCVRIVRTVAKTMPAGSRLLVIEGSLGRNNVDPRFSMIDLQMLVVTEGGRERSSDQLMAILVEAGLLAGQTRHATTGLALLDATKPPAPTNAVTSA